MKGGINMFIDEKYINKLLDYGKNTKINDIEKVLDKAERIEGLSIEEVSSLLYIEDEKQVERLFKIAGAIKEKIYGDRVVMFAPLYISDYCVNKCDYCGFGCDNKFERKKLTQDEIRKEVRELVKMGHKRLALEAGEDPVNCKIDYVLESLSTIYDMKFENGQIRRVNVNIASTTVENYKKLNEAGIGTYILFQETYNKKAYERVHKSGPKANYEYHTTAFHRAMEAGIDDVGGGVLFGLYDYRFEILGITLHNKELKEKFGVGFHTVSMPRLCNAEGLDENGYGYSIDDETFKKIIAIIRIAIPYAGIIISTRETEEMRKFLINIGVTQVSGGSSVEVGGYTKRDKAALQFSVSDERSIDEIMRWLVSEDYVPSFCTACYRKGRTGDRFMEIVKKGDIKNVCLPNAILTLYEYGLDYGDEDFKTKIKDLIKRKIEKENDKDIENYILNGIKKLDSGDRDVFI